MIDICLKNLMEFVYRYIKIKVNFKDICCLYIFIFILFFIYFFFFYFISFILFYLFFILFKFNFIIFIYWEVGDSDFVIWIWIRHFTPRVMAHSSLTSANTHSNGAVALGNFSRTGGGWLFRKVSRYPRTSVPIAQP